MRGWKQATVVGLIGVMTIAGAASSHVAHATMTDEYSTRVAFACNKVHLWGLGPEKARDTTDMIVRDSTQAGFIHGKPSMDRPDLFEALQGLRDETLADYYVRNRHPVELRSLDTLPEVEVLSPARADSITQLARRGGDPYAFLHSRYPHAAGMVGMSRPGMSRDGRQALVEVGWSKAPLHGGGRLLLLACRGGKWTLLDWFQTWVS